MSKKYMKYILIIFLVFVGVVLRFLVMTFGYNYDWESWCVVGEIAGNFRNVYAETTRYNYGMIFFCIQGLLYRIASVMPGSLEEVYRLLMVSMLTFCDMSIMFYIGARHNIKKALLFFLNPISIIITGYHNQFDNVAILLALLTVLLYNEDEGISKKDIGFVVTFTACLMTKHILFLFPVFLLMRPGLKLKKKCLYAFVPTALFLLGFVPFGIHSQEAMLGIMNNVFLYRSINNAPLLSFIYDNVNGLPSYMSFVVYVVMMILMAVVSRKRTYEEQVCIYLIAMVSFSSAIANQYLVIPVVGLILLDTGLIKYIYMVLMGIYLCMQSEGLGLIQKIRETAQYDKITFVCEYFILRAYTIAAVILLIVIIYICFWKKTNISDESL